MKILLMVTLVLHLLMELMAAVALIGGPEGVGNAGAGNMWSMHYGFAALAIASISVWVWPKRTDAISRCRTSVTIKSIFIRAPLYVFLFAHHDSTSRHIMETAASLTEDKEMIA